MWAVWWSDRCQKEPDAGELGFNIAFNKDSACLKYRASVLKTLLGHIIPYQKELVTLQYKWQKSYIFQMVATLFHLICVTNNNDSYLNMCCYSRAFSWVSEDVAFWAMCHRMQTVRYNETEYNEFRHYKEWTFTLRRKTSDTLYITLTTSATLQ